MKKLSQQIVSSSLFKRFIIGAIVFAGLLVGIETHQPTLEPQAQSILGVIYFGSFVLLGTMIMLNLVIGAIVNGMDDARVDAEIESIKRAEAALENSDDALSLENQISALSNQLRDLNKSVARLFKSVGKDSI